MSESRSLKKIKSHGLARNLALGKLSLMAGVRGASHVLTNLVTGKSEERTFDMLMRQAQSISQELGQLKGSVMKMGQMLSVLGEHFLPPHVNEVLKTLQNQSPPLDWAAIEKTLRKQYASDLLDKLNVNPEALACASLGQVHLAEWNGEKIALKVQYPGVEKAIDSDIRTLRFILSMANLIPGDVNLDPIFDEVRGMLKQEVDYRREAKNTLHFAELLKDDPRYIVPKVFEEISTARVLATRFEPGVAFDSPEVQALSQERRNRLAQNILDLYFRELFEWRVMQTDPHFGNYRIRINPDGNDQIILLDFGAVRKYPKTFISSYALMVRGVVNNDSNDVIAGSRELGFIQDGDSPELQRTFYDFCALVGEPFAPDVGIYDWGQSDLPKRLMAKGGELIRSFKLRTPPRELVFLDRKTAGVFTMLSKLKAQVNSRTMAVTRIESVRPR